MTLFNVIFFQIFLRDWGELGEQLRPESDPAIYCTISIFLIGLLFLLLFLTTRNQSGKTPPSPDDYPIKLWHKFEEVSGKKTLYLRWRDKHHPPKGEKRYILYKRITGYTTKVSQVGTTDELFLIDHCFNSGDFAIYWVECLEDKRESNRHYPDIFEY